MNEPVYVVVSMEVKSKNVRYKPCVSRSEVQDEVEALEEAGFSCVETVAISEGEYSILEAQPAKVSVMVRRRVTVELRFGD